LSQKEAQEILKEAHDGCMKRINLVQSLEIDFEDSDIFGQRRS